MGSDPEFWRTFAHEELVLQYTPSSMIGGDNSSYLCSYREHSHLARERLQVYEDLHYGYSSQEVLDFFPVGRSGAPLHVFIHGGYWQALSHKDAAAMVASVHQAGAHFAVVNYTIAPQGTLPQMIMQVRQALEWLMQQGERFQFDPNKISVSGHSAGAHLLAHAMQQPLPYLLHCGVFISGIFDIRPIVRTPINNLLGLTEQAAIALSVHQKNIVGTRSVVVVVADNDTPEFRRQARAFSKNHQTNCVKNHFFEFKNLNHFDIVLPDSRAEHPLRELLQNFIT